MRLFLLKLLKLSFLSCIMLSGSLLLNAKDRDTELVNPSATMFTHLHYLQHANYEPQKAGKTIRVADKNKADELAVQLKLYLDAKLMIVDTAMVSNNANYKDYASGRHVYYPFEDNKDIYLQKIGENWYYSAHTAARIPELYKQAVPFGSDLLISLFGKWGQQDLTGLWIWQWFGLMIFLVLFVVVYRIQSFVIDKLVRGILFQKKFLESETIRHIHSFGKYGSIYLMFHYSREMFPALQMPVFVNLFVLRGLGIASVVFLVMVLFKTIDLLMIRYMKFVSGKEIPLGEQFAPVLQKLLKAIAVAFGILFMMRSLGVNLGALLAGVSIAGLALALAAQDTVKNFFGSIMIFLDQPFKVGDRISVDSVDGVVELVSIRATRIRTFDNSLVYIPNGKLADGIINNFGLRVYRRYRTMISITYDTPTVLIDAYVEGLRKLIALHPYSRKDFYQVYLNEFSSSSLNILLNMHFEVDDFLKELQGKHELMTGAIKLAENLGVRFAFHTTTLHIEEFPGKESLTPKYQTAPEKIKSAIENTVEEMKGVFDEGKDA
jgi:MscS family membrane protein